MLLTLNAFDHGSKIQSSPDESSRPLSLSLSHVTDIYIILPALFSAMIISSITVVLEKKVWWYHILSAACHKKAAFTPNLAMCGKTTVLPFLCVGAVKFNVRKSGVCQKLKRTQLLWKCDSTSHCSSNSQTFLVDYLGIWMVYLVVTS